MADENDFEGITEIENNLRGWQWIYGRTPRFSVSRTFTSNGHSYSVNLEVMHGLIDIVTINGIDTDVGLKGIRFCEEHVSQVLSDLCCHNFVRGAQTPSE